jgi:hypothetical protein
VQVAGAPNGQEWLDLDEAAARLHTSKECVTVMALQGPLRYRPRSDALQVNEKSVERELNWRTGNPTLRKARNSLRYLFRYVL